MHAMTSNFCPPSGTAKDFFDGRLERNTDEFADGIAVPSERAAQKTLVEQHRIWRAKRCHVLQRDQSA